MTGEGHPPRGAGAGSRSATTALVLLFGLTLVLVAASFPAGIYAVFHGGLSSTLGFGSFVPTFLWVGPVPAIFPFTVPIGALFLVLVAAYAVLFVVGWAQPKNPLDAIRGAYRDGVGALLASPFLVILIAIGFINFTADVIVQVSQAAAGSVGNPFSGVDYLLEFGSLTFAPLREEFGFRVVLIGLVAFILSMGKPLREAAKSLWRPSAAYEGALVGGAVSTIIWVATAASAATFGLCHVTCGGGNSWSWSKFPEAAWGGLVLGYLYVRYGFHVAVLTHWGLDYLGSVFVYFGQSAYGIPVGSTTAQFLGAYLVEVDLVLLLGIASFILVVYLGVKKLTERKKKIQGLDFNGLPAGGGVEP